MRIPNPLKQRLGLVFAIQSPGCVKDFVPTMFGVCLGEHHQLDVGWIAA